MSTITPVAQGLPKVGVWVLAYNAEYAPSKWRVMRLADDGYWEALDRYSNTLEQYLAAVRPTHWMPQPKFPPPTDAAL